MVEQFAQRPALAGPSGLTSVYSIECLVKEESDRPAGVYPRRTILVESWCIPKQGKKVGYDESETRKSYLWSCVSGKASICSGTIMFASSQTYEVGSDTR